MQCPICGGALSVQVHRRVPDFEHGLPVAADFDACAACGLIAQVPPPAAAVLAGYYPTDYRPHAAAAKGANGVSLLTRLKNLQASLQIARLSRFLPEPGQPILELGCGGGHFLRALDRHGHTDLLGIDRTPELGRAFEGTRIRYRPLDLDRSLDLGGPYRAIVMNYVIEHFVSPEAVLRACRKALAPGGRVLLLTPNSRALSHRVFGRYWSGLHAPRHTQLFNPHNLGLLAKKAGFSGVQVLYPTDAASWTLSFQNRVQGFRRSGKPPRAGTSWYSLALLPAWYPFALAERLIGRASSMFAVLTA
ncbi:MAG: class I SAM-dependent methyltransferase [Myxococcales bacterium]